VGCVRLAIVGHERRQHSPPRDARKVVACRRPGVVGAGEAPPVAATTVTCSALNVGVGSLTAQAVKSSGRIRRALFHPALSQFRAIQLLTHWARSDLHLASFGRYGEGSHLTYLP